MAKFGGMNQLQIFFISTACGCLSMGCHGPLREARRAAEGTGNVEMHRMVEAYAGDPERLEAAAFLLENMSGHGTYTFDLVDAVSGLWRTTPSTGRRSLRGIIGLCSTRSGWRFATGRRAMPRR